MAATRSKRTSTPAPCSSDVSVRDLIDAFNAEMRETVDCFFGDDRLSDSVLNAINNAIKPVGERVFHDLAITTTDGLPPDDPIAYAMWKGGFHSSRKASSVELKKCARLALQVENEVHKAIRTLLQNDSFQKFVLAEAGRANAKNKKARATPFLNVLEPDPSITTAKAIEKMVEAGTLIDKGDCYLEPDSTKPESEWRRYVAAGLATKFSRLRRDLKSG